MAYLIGGLSEFWEYCYDYYGLCSNIPLNDLIKLTEEHLQVTAMFKSTFHRLNCLRSM